MREYILPIPELKRLEPILTEYFGYRRAMFECDLLRAYHANYPNGIGGDIANKYMVACPYLDEFEADDGAFDYKRYTPRPASTSKVFDISSFMMDTDHEISIELSDDLLPKLEKLLQEYGEVSNDIIGMVLFIVAAIYEKYSNNRLDIEITISEDTLPYLTKVRPEMLKLYELLNTKRYSPKKKKETRLLNHIVIDNGMKEITLDNSCYWLTDLLDNYLHIYLGVDSLEEAQQELKEVYAAKKGRKTSNTARELVMYGTFHLLQKYSLLRIKKQQLRMTLDYMGLLFKEGDFNNDENSANSSIANLIKKGYKPQWKPKQIEEYKFSPNNPSCNNFW